MGSSREDCLEKLEQWLGVPGKGTFGDQDPFDEVEGGKEAILNKLVDVNDDVKYMPEGNNPYSAVKFGTLVGQSTLSRRLETAARDRTLIRVDAE